MTIPSYEKNTLTYATRESIAKDMDTCICLKRKQDIHVVIDTIKETTNEHLPFNKAM